MIEPDEAREEARDARWIWAKRVDPNSPAFGGQVPQCGSCQNPAQDDPVIVKIGGLVFAICGRCRAGAVRVMTDPQAPEPPARLAVPGPVRFTPH